MDLSLLFVCSSLFFDFLLSHILHTPKKMLTPHVSQKGCTTKSSIVEGATNSNIVETIDYHLRIGDYLSFLVVATKT